MTYLKYSNTCADLVRQALKEPARSKVLNRAGFSMVKGEWKDGRIVERSKLHTLYFQLAILQLPSTNRSIDLDALNIC